MRMDTLLLDLRLGWRSLRRNTAFSAAALLTLALGIGGTCAIFGVLNGVFLRPLPFEDEARLVRLRDFTAAPGGAISPVNITGRHFLEILAQSRTLSGQTAPAMHGGFVDTQDAGDDGWGLTAVEQFDGPTATTFQFSSGSKRSCGPSWPKTLAKLLPRMPARPASLKRRSPIRCLTGFHRNRTAGITSCGVHALGCRARQERMQRALD